MCIPEIAERKAQMKLETALRHAAEIARRLESVNGLIPTPRGEREFYLVKKAWVFGSTIKGSDAPNDLGGLLFAERAGARQNTLTCASSCCHN